MTQPLPEPLSTGIRVSTNHGESIVPFTLAQLDTLIGAIAARESHRKKAIEEAAATLKLAAEAGCGCWINVGASPPTSGVNAAIPAGRMYVFSLDPNFARITDGPLS